MSGSVLFICCKQQMCIHLYTNLRYFFYSFFFNDYTAKPKIILLRVKLRTTLILRLTTIRYSLKETNDGEYRLYGKNMVRPEEV